MPDFFDPKDLLPQDFDPKDQDKTHLPHFKHSSNKDPKTAQKFDLIAFIQNQEPERKNSLANLLATCLLHHLATPTLQDAVNAERQSKRSNVEGLLKQIIEMDGVSIHPDILYGKEISPETRIRWQEMGMDPDSEDEVFSFLQKNDIGHLFRLNENSVEEMQEYAEAHGLLDSETGPDNKKPKK